jgi:hypothetical protein
MATLTNGRQREAALSRVLTVYIMTGLAFMLVPGTLLGVWNLMLASSRESVSLVPAAWLQAHGHAQVFGWIGTFILGIGFYSIPRVRAGTTPAMAAVWTCWALWTTGVAMRWGATVYAWQWQVLVPLSAACELAAFLIFLVVVSRHRPAAGGALPSWIAIVMSASAGLLLTLVVNLAIAVYLAGWAASPEVPHGLNQRFLVLAAYGFLAPFVWGFSLNWLPVLAGLAPPRTKAVTAIVACNAAGVLCALSGWMGLATVVLALAAVVAAVALRIFEPSVRPAKTRGVHASFPIFVRLAYAWLMVAALLGIAAARWDVSGGIWGASRHAFTVGFISTMVFSIGQRMLPQFAGLRPLWSPRLMFVGLLLISLGCTLRVGSEVIAYQHYAAWAWSVLPVSAILEMAAVTAFALNLVGTLVDERPVDAVSCAI